MEEQDLFRTAIFGGYQKDDVSNYVDSLQNENRVLRILSDKEKKELKDQLEKAEALNEELNCSLAVLQEKIDRLEMEARKPAEHSLSSLRGDEYMSLDEGAIKEEFTAFMMEEKKELLENQIFWAEDMIQLLLGLQKQHKYWQDELKKLRLTFESLQVQLRKEKRQEGNASPAPADCRRNIPHTDSARSKSMSYSKKLNMSVIQTQKRIADLLQALGDF